MITYLIYLHKNKINNKCYVGQTCHSENPNKRWRNGEGYSSQKDFYEDIIKYGWDNFEHIVLEDNLLENQIQERENYWINFYSTLNPNFGYNRKQSGSYGPMSEKAKQNIRDGWTQEQKIAQSIRLKEKWQNDPIFRQKALTALQNAEHKPLTGEKNGMYGVHRYGKDAPRRKKVRCINTGEIFNTIKEAAEWIGSIGQKSHISEVCKGTRNYAGKHPITGEPLHWEYIQEE